MSKDFPLPVTDTQNENALAKGDVQNRELVEKFANNADVDTGTVPEDIWDGGGTYTFTAAGGAPYFISSSSASDTTKIRVFLLTEDSEGNWNQEVFEITLAGQTKTAIITPSGNDPVRIWRAFSDNGTALVGDVYVYEDDTVSAGVPQTASLIRAKILIGNEQTEMSHFPIPSGKSGLLKSIYSSLSKSTPATSAEVTLRVQEFGKTAKVKFRMALTTSGTSFEHYNYHGGLVIPAKSDVFMKVEEVTANNTGVTGGFSVELYNP